MGFQLLVLFSGLVPSPCRAKSAPEEAEVQRSVSDDLAPEHFHSGNRLLRAGDLLGAAAAYKQALQIRPWDPAFYVNLATALLQQGAARRQEAEAAARSAVTVAPAMARAHYVLGQVMMQDGHQSRQGLRRLGRAAALDPADVDIHLGLARESNRAGQFNTALQHFHAAVQLRPADSTAKEQLGYVLSKTERLLEAREWLESAVADGPSYASVAKLVEVLLWLGDEAVARQLARRSVDELRLWKYPMQRPTMLYRPELLAKPWWSVDDATSLQMVARHLVQLADPLEKEFAALQAQRPGGWRHQPERIHEPGRGRWKEWKVQDERNTPCRHRLFPRTCAAISSINGIVDVQWAEYSVLEPGAHIRPHTGPTNDRLTLHLCLTTPEDVRIRVGDGEAISYQNGSILFFDDSFEHEVWHSGDHDRVVLLLQFSHPDSATGQATSRARSEL